VTAAVELLEQGGPALGRPLVDTLKGSRHPNMKELRPRGGQMRVLFAFDPRRMAILLLGGDKSRRWSGWYAEAIPAADQLYDEHLQTLPDEGAIHDPGQDHKARQRIRRVAQADRRRSGSPRAS